MQRECPSKGGKGKGQDNNFYGKGDNYYGKGGQGYGGKGGKSYGGKGGKSYGGYGGKDYGGGKGFGGKGKGEGKGYQGKCFNCNEIGHKKWECTKPLYAVDEQEDWGAHAAEQ